jgi:hypothetical protein
MYSEMYSKKWLIPRNWQEESATSKLPLLARSNYIGFTYRIPISLLYSFTVYNWRKKNSSEKEKAGKSD